MAMRISLSISDKKKWNEEVKNVYVVSKCETAAKVVFARGGNLNEMYFLKMYEILL